MSSRSRGRSALSPVYAWGFAHVQCALGSLGALWRARLGTALVAAVIGVALALPAGVYIAMETVADVSDRFSSPVDLSVFLQPAVDDAQASRLADAVQSRPEVTRVRVIGKAQALAEFSAASGMGYGLESLGGANPLPAVLVVTPASADEEPLGRLRTWLDELPDVEFVQTDQAWLERLRAVTDVGRRALWLLGLLLGAGVVLVVGTTLQMSIEARRAEIEIAKLFGGSDAFVRRPFLYHGFLYGLAGAVVACVLLIGAGLVLQPALERLAALYGSDLSGAGAGAGHLAWLLLGGGGLGLLGAWLCVGRQLQAIEPR